jgi:hypothetical protein
VVSELITFVRAQLDEDERVARRATAGAWVETITEGRSVCGVQALGRLNGIPATSVPGWADAVHIARHDPARVLAEVEAKRRLLDLHEPYQALYGVAKVPQCSHCSELCHSRSGLGCDNPDAPYPCPTVRLLALPYAGREGYDETWRPE